MLPVIKRLMLQKKRKRAKRVLGAQGPTPELCGQISVALATDTALDNVLEFTGRRTVQTKEISILLRKLGANVSLVHGPAFARFYEIYKSRLGGDEFRAIALNLDDSTNKAHALYLEGDYVFNPADQQWRKTTELDRAGFDWLLVLQP